MASLTCICLVIKRCNISSVHDEGNWRSCSTINKRQFCRASAFCMWTFFHPNSISVAFIPQMFAMQTLHPLSFSYLTHEIWFLASICFANEIGYIFNVTEDCYVLIKKIYNFLLLWFFKIILRLMCIKSYYSSIFMQQPKTECLLLHFLNWGWRSIHKFECRHGEKEAYNNVIRAPIFRVKVMS